MEKKKILRRENPGIVIILGYILIFVGQLIGLLIANLIGFSVKDSAWLFLIATYLPFIGIYPVVFYYCYRRQKDIFKTFFHKGIENNTMKYLLYGLILGFLLNMICAIIAIFNHDIALTYAGFDIVYMIVAFILVLIQSGAEELVFRGYMYQTIAKNYHPYFAAVINSAIFMLIHIGNPGVTVTALLSILFVGIAMSLIVYKTQSLWMAAGIHAAWNYTQNIILGLPNSGLVSEKALMKVTAVKSSFAYNVNFGIEGSVVSVIIFVIMTIILLTLKNKKKLES